MRLIKISENLTLPIEAVTQTFGIMARRGAGKTYSAGVLVEGMYRAGGQVVVLDAIGNWWGLRLASDGKKPGLDMLVIGGDHGDLPIDPSAGKLLAELIVEKRISCVLDISEFSKSKFKEFVYQFATKLLHLKKSHRSPIHIVFEEAQLVAPQRVDRDSGKMMGAVESLIRLGRNYGIGSTLISQRPQSVHKDVLNQVECLLVGQINGAHERKAIQDWVVEKGIDIKEMVRELPSLPIGTMFIWSPQWLQLFKKIKIRRKTTYDASSTPTFSTKKSEPMKLMPVDIKAVKDAIASISEKTKTENPTFLKNQIQKLTTENARIKRDLEKLKATPDKKVQVTACGIDPKNKDKVIAAINSMVKTVISLLGDETYSPKTIKESKNLSAVVDHSVLKGGAARMAKVLAQIFPRKVTKNQLGTLAGLKHTSGTFGTYLSQLRAESIVQEESGLFYASQYCQNLYENTESIPTKPDELLEFWKGKFNGGAVRMLDVVASRKGDFISREEIGNLADISPYSGTFGTYISSLISNGLVEKSNNGSFRICDELIAGD